MKKNDDKICVLGKLEGGSIKLSGSDALVLANKVKEFNDNYVKFITNPNSAESQRFLKDFIVFIRDYYKKIMPTLENAVLFEPKKYELHHQILTHIVTIVPGLLQFKLYDDMKELLDVTCDILLPYLEHKAATVFVEKEKGVKGINFIVKRFDGNLIAALIYCFRGLQQVKTGDVKSAELSLNHAQEFRHKTNNLDKSHQDIFHRLLNDNKKKFRTDYIAKPAEWKSAMNNIRRLEEKPLQNSMDYIHYYAWANLSLDPAVLNFTLAECYCDMALDYYNKLRINGKKVGELITPVTASNLLYLIAKQHKLEGNLNSALRCLTKARGYHVNYKNQLIEGRKKNQNMSLPKELFEKEFGNSCKRILEIDELLHEIHDAAFLQFKKEWTDFPQVALIRTRFEEKNLMLVDFSDRALMKLWTRELKQLQIHFSINENTITLHNVHQLSAKQMFQSIERSQKHLFQDRIKVQKRIEYLAEMRNKAVEKPETSLDESPLFEMKHDPAKDLYPVVKPIQKKNAKTKLVEAKVSPIEIIPEIDWSDDIPDYINIDDIHPIPDPNIANSSIPKDIFYGYIDHLLITNPDVDDKKIAEFQKILSRGKVAAEGNSQGIRPVQGELGHDSDYIFKLNGHAEDVRFYGRIVAKKSLPDGNQVVLIAFDQAIPHNKTLKLHCTSPVNQLNVS